MMRCSAIRFVGGPWHNRIVECRLHEIYKVIKPVPADCFVVEPYLHEPAEFEDYHLRKFNTGWSKRETAFWQYVHTSLLRADGVDRSAYREEFPPLPSAPFIRFFDQLINVQSGLGGDWTAMA